jgi:hypothetical protein
MFQRAIPVMLLAFAIGFPTESSADDVNNAYALGDAAVKSGLAVEYEVSGWHSRLDVNISSLLPGDARTVANALCTIARQKQTWQRPWTVRVFLTVGDRPAATCTTM